MKSLIGKRWELLAGLLILGLALLFMRLALVPPPGKVVGAHDMRGLFYPWFSFIKDSILVRSIPFWDPYQFAGYPFLSNPQVGFFYPPVWLNIIIPVNISVSLYLLFHIWLAGFGMLLYVRYMGGGRLGSIVAGIIYAFSGFTAVRIWAGHIGLLATFSWLPWLLLSTAWTVKKGSIWSAIIAGVPFGLAVLAGHMPSFLYVGFIWIVFVFYLAFEKKNQWKTVVRQSIIVSVTGIGLSAIQLLPFIELSLNSQRVAGTDFEFATNFSLPPSHLITLALPEFFGEPIRAGYWSVPTFEELTYYAGLIALLGIILAVRKPTRLSWFYILLLVVGIWLAMGRYSALYRIVYDTVPVVRLMRAPGRAAVLFIFAAPALFGHTLTNWLEIPREERKTLLDRFFKGLLILILIVGVTAIAATGAIFLSVHPTETSGRLWHQLGGYLIALIIALIVSVLLWKYLAESSKKESRAAILAIALIIVVVADLWQFGLKYVQLEPTGPSDLWLDSKAIIGDEESRVLPWGVSIFDQSGGMQVGLNSVFGYQALEPSNLVAFVSEIPDPRSTAYDVMGAGYVIAPVPLDEFTESDGALQLVEHRGNTWVYRRPNALPINRLVYEVEIIPDDNLARSRVHAPDFDPSNTAILNQKSSCVIGPQPDLPGTVVVDERRPGYWKVKTESQQPGLLVLAESDYPGWRVKVDGERAAKLGAYTTLQAVCLPAGTHTIEWHYVPQIFLYGGLISLLTIVIVAIAIFYGYRQSQIRNQSSV